MTYNKYFKCADCGKKKISVEDYFTDDYYMAPEPEWFCHKCEDWCEVKETFRLRVRAAWNTIFYKKKWLEEANND